MSRNENSSSRGKTTVRQCHCPSCWLTVQCSAGDTDGVETLYTNAETLHQEREWARLSSWSPSSWKKSNADSPTAPRVSTAMGVKSYSGGRLLYFDFLVSSVSFATALGPTTALLRWLKASVYGQVKSHARERPWAHCTIVRPTGVLPSSRLSDAGSNMAVWLVSLLTQTLVWWDRWLRCVCSDDRQT